MSRLNVAEEISSVVINLAADTARTTPSKLRYRYKRTISLMPALILSCIKHHTRLVQAI